MKRATALLVVALSLAACGTLAGVFSSQGPTPETMRPAVHSPFNPPAWYRDAWEYVQKCSGITPKPGYSVDSVVFRVFPAASWNVGVKYEKRTYVFRVNGYWGHSPTRTTGKDTIFLDREYVDSVRTVRHELLHYLRAVPGHPTFPFQFPCKVMP
jgi:hypothetical protein